jgi:hypothetical protein
MKIKDLHLPTILVNIPKTTGENQRKRKKEN